MPKIKKFSAISCPIESAYIAGVIDSIACYNLRVYDVGYEKWNCGLVIATLNGKLVNFLNSKFKTLRNTANGELEHDYYKRNKGNTVIKWIANGDLLHHILSITINNLVIHKEPAELMLRFLNTGHYWGKGTPEYVKEERREIKKKFDESMSFLRMRRPHRNRHKKMENPLE